MSGLESTSPFVEIFGKRIDLLSVGSTYSTGRDIGQAFLISYLFAAGADRWNSTRFNRVWEDCVGYFDPNRVEVESYLYAPISGIPGSSAVRRILDLGEGLEIRKKSPVETAQLATTNPLLGGGVFYFRFHPWSTRFFVSRFKSEKKIHEELKVASSRLEDKWTSRLNEEIIILRSLFGHEVGASSYAIIRHAFSPTTSSPSVSLLPWQFEFAPFVSHPTRYQIDAYLKRRKRFRDLEGKPGWRAVAASMRRFAIAWENEFRADILTDIVSALESLVVQGSKQEVSYKLRLRTSHFLTKSREKRYEIFSNLRDAYAYRSRVAHGEFVLDDMRGWNLAKRLKPKRRKLSAEIMDFRKVVQLTNIVSQYYRNVLFRMIDTGKLDVDWPAQAR